MSLSISNTGLDLIKKFEGCRLTSYQDSVDVWTIGYGHTSGVKNGQTITQIQADAYLKADCTVAEKAVNSYDSKYNWNQNQFDALVSFTFNLGAGNLKTLLQNGTRTIAQISSMITAYNKAGGKVLQGLTNRRTAEKELFDRETEEGGMIMGILVGHASISETSGINGTKGDSTGKEVCTRTWYSKPWDYMAVHPNATVREKHAKAIEAACANDNIGYGQSDRNTANTEAKKVNYDIAKITTKCNTDCSALQNLAAVASGASGVTYGSNGWTTSTMKSALQSAGYKIITDKTILASADYCVRGAIYVKSGSHTVCGLTNGSKYATTLSKAGITVSSTATSTSTTTSTSKLKVTSTVKAIQTWLNTYYNTGLSVDGSYGSKTKAALVKAWQTEVGGLTVDGSFGTKSKAAASSHNIKKGSTGILVTIWQAYLVCRGYNPNGIDGSFGAGCHTATVAFQKSNGLIQDGIVGANTWVKAFT